MTMLHATNGSTSTWERYPTHAPTGTRETIPLNVPIPSGVQSWELRVAMITDGTPRTRPSDGILRERFEVLAEWWHADTDALSSPSRILGHPAYRKMVQMGEQAIPWMLRDLRDNDGEWFAALQQLTGKSLVSEDHDGDFDVARDAWLEWGRREGLI